MYPDEELGIVTVVNPLATEVHKKKFEEIDLGHEEKTDFTIIRDMLPKISDIVSSKPKTESFDISESSKSSKLSKLHGENLVMVLGTDTDVLDTDRCIFIPIWMLVIIFIALSVWCFII